MRASASASARGRPSRPPPRARLAAGITTVAVTAVSYAAPKSYAGTLVGLTFFAATFWLVLRYDESTIRAHGLSLGGLLEPVPLSPKRLVRAALRAVAWAALVAAIVFPLFWLGYRLYWGATSPFVLRPPPSLADEIAAQLLVVALPEEAFFRGYLQSALDRVFPPRFRVAGATLGPAWLSRRRSSRSATCSRSSTRPGSPSSSPRSSSDGCGRAPAASGRRSFSTRRATSSPSPSPAVTACRREHLALGGRAARGDAAPGGGRRRAAGRPRGAARRC